MIDLIQIESKLRYGFVLIFDRIKSKARNQTELCKLSVGERDYDRETHSNERQMIEFQIEL